MKNLRFILFIFIVICVPAFAAKDVPSTKVDYIYQLDSDATVFVFKAPVVNICGNTMYIVRSPNEAVANRKFALVLAAFTSDKQIQFHDSEVCEDGRSVVKWIRLVK